MYIQHILKSVNKKNVHNVWKENIDTSNKHIYIHISYSKTKDIINMATKWTKEYDNASGQYYYLNSMDSEKKY